MERKQKMSLVNMPVLKEKLREREEFLQARRQNPELTPEEFLASKSGQVVSQRHPTNAGKPPLVPWTPQKGKSAISLGKISKHTVQRTQKLTQIPPQRNQAPEDTESDPFVREFKELAQKLEHKHREAVMDIKIQRLGQLKEDAKVAHESEKQEVDKIILRRMRVSKSVPVNDPSTMATTKTSQVRLSSNVSLSKLFRASQAYEPSKSSQRNEEGTAVFFRMNKLAENILPRSFVNDSLQVLDSAGRTVGSENQVSAVAPTNSHDTRKLQIVFEKKPMNRSVVTPSTPSTSPFLLRTAKMPAMRNESFKINTLGNETLSMLECLKEPGQAESGWTHRYQNGNDFSGPLTDRVKFSEDQNSKELDEWRTEHFKKTNAVNKSASLAGISRLSGESRVLVRANLEKISDSVMAKLRLRMKEKQKEHELSLKTHGSAEVQYLEKAGFPVFKVKEQTQMKARHTTRDRANIHGGTILLNQPTQIGLMGRLPFPIQFFNRE